MKKGLKIGGEYWENPQIVARLYRFFSIARFCNGSSICSCENDIKDINIDF